MKIIFRGKEYDTEIDREKENLEKLKKLEEERVKIANKIFLGNMTTGMAFFGNIHSTTLKI